MKLCRSPRSAAEEPERTGVGLLNSEVLFEVQGDDLRAWSPVMEATHSLHWIWRDVQPSVWQFDSEHV